jgi:hypothetical protein
MRAKACPRCQTVAQLDAQQCGGCGHVFRTQFAPPDQTQMINTGAEPTLGMNPPGWTPPFGATTERESSFAIASLVCGICSIVLGCVWWIGVPAGVVGIVLAVKGMRSNLRGLGIAGLVTSIVGLAWAGSVAVLWLIGHFNSSPDVTPLRRPSWP